MTDPGADAGTRSDTSLIDDWKRGDQRAAAELVERHGAALARFATASGVRDASEAEELVQDTFVKAFGAIDSFRGDSAFRTWLISIERRLILDRRRAAARRPRESELHEAAAVSEFSALDGLVAQETAGRVRDALASLTPTQRDVFVLRVSEGLSYRDIAGIVGTTEGAARVHYHHALRTIRELLDV